MQKLRFVKANVKLKKLEKKLGKKVVSINLLSGWSCPWAKECKSKVVVRNGHSKVQDGPQTKFRCYSASSEATYPSVFENHKYNFDLLKKCQTIDQSVKLIEKSLPSDFDIVRIHANGGDFFRLNYFKAWLKIAEIYNTKVFYAYTKAIKHWINQKDKIPANFLLTASYGGKDDDLISLHKLRYTKVVFSFEEAKSLKLEIDHDDSHAAMKSKVLDNFALLIHGIMPKGSEAAKAKQELKKLGWKGYGQKA